jgi:archaellum component FlaC
MFFLTLAAMAVSHGAHRQRTDNIDSEVKALGERVTAVEALKISVEGLSRGIEHLGERLVDSQKLNASELGRLADQLAAGQKLMDARFDAMKELSVRELDEVKHGVRNIRQALESAQRQIEHRSTA